ncbi:MAG: hypothetical protein SFU25_09565 [Candidatus Caenarcaniphilales bacterium]|nr:hypothetical protein [Candidatus Caenarcaniphilales bacterium]
MVEMQRGNDWGAPGLMLYSLTRGWLIGLPILFVITIICSKGYKGETPLYIWNKTRPYWSTLWTVIFGYLIVEAAVFAIKGFVTLHIEDVLSQIFGIYIYSCLRSSMITSSWFVNHS